MGGVGAEENADARVVSVGLVLVGVSAAAAAHFEHAGPAGNGAAVTPVGFRVTPAGRQTTLGDLPLTSAVSPNRRAMPVVNAGDGDQSVQVVDLTNSRVVQTLTYKAPQVVFAGARSARTGTMPTSAAAAATSSAPTP